MGLDTSIRVGLVFGVVSGLSWWLFADDDLGSAVNSLVAGVLGFTIAYAVSSLLAELLEEHANHHRRRDHASPPDPERHDGNAE